MVNKTQKTHLDKLLEDKAFKVQFEEEYAKLCIAEEIAKARHEANLSQSELARKIGTSKTAISRYESGAYTGHSIRKLAEIAEACGATLQVRMTAKRSSNGSLRKARS